MYNMTLPKLIEDLAKHRMSTELGTKQLVTQGSKGRKKVLKWYIKRIKKDIQNHPTLRNLVMNTIKYGEHRAVRMQIISRDFSNAIST